MTDKQSTQLHNRGILLLAGVVLVAIGSGWLLLVVGMPLVKSLTMPGEQAFFREYIGKHKVFTGVSVGLVFLVLCGLLLLKYIFLYSFSNDFYLVPLLALVPLFVMCEIAFFQKNGLDDHSL